MIASKKAPGRIGGQEFFFDYSDAFEGRRMARIVGSKSWSVCFCGCSPDIKKGRIVGRKHPANIYIYIFRRLVFPKGTRQRQHHQQVFIRNVKS